VEKRGSEDTEKVPEKKWEFGFAGRVKMSQESDWKTEEKIGRI
jgi:hypothetical protein